MTRAARSSTARAARFGVLSTLQIAPLAGANGVSDLSRMIAYMESHGGPDVTLAQRHRGLPRPAAALDGQ